jgi:cytochrome c oxidase assembly protein subunit 15
MTLGAWVKANGAGLSCPDWPSCYGRYLPPFPSAETQGQYAGIQGPTVDHAEAYTQAQVLYEWAHRAVVALLSIPVLIFAVLAARGKELSHNMRRLPVAGALLYVTQAFLGAVTVATGNPPWATTLHLLTAVTFLLVLTVATCIAHLRPFGEVKVPVKPKPATLITVPEQRRIEFVYSDETAPANRDNGT